MTTTTTHGALAPASRTTTTTTWRHRRRVTWSAHLHRLPGSCQSPTCSPISDRPRLPPTTSLTVTWRNVTGRKRKWTTLRGAGRVDHPRRPPSTTAPSTTNRRRVPALPGHVLPVAGRHGRSLSYSARPVTSRPRSWRHKPTWRCCVLTKVKLSDRVIRYHWRVKQTERLSTRYRLTLTTVAYTVDDCIAARNISGKLLISIM